MLLRGTEQRWAALFVVFFKQSFWHLNKFSSTNAPLILTGVRTALVLKTTSEHLLDFDGDKSVCWLKLKGKMKKSGNKQILKWCSSSWAFHYGQKSKGRKDAQREESRFVPMGVDHLTRKHTQKQNEAVCRGASGTFYRSYEDVVEEVHHLYSVSAVERA